jgi:altronate dehydratase
MTFRFEAVARMADAGDNVAIATRILPPESVILHDDSAYSLPYGVLEGHRFAARTIAAGETLRSWGQSFGVALREISAGEYVCNADVLVELNRRKLDFPLPDAPNFQNDLEVYRFDEVSFRPADPLPLYHDQRHFMGYAREGGRGVGTRNMVVLLGTSVLSSGFVEQLQKALLPLLAEYPQIDGIVPAAHTEGGHANPNNRELLLRTLAGFMVNPNVGAVLAVDYGNDAVTNADLQAYMRENGYPLDAVLHRFMSMEGAFSENLSRAQEIVQRWLPQVAQMTRTAQPLSALKIGLQCGGSDAFSGISGNPLAAWVSKEIIRYGGAVNLAETDELIGAESYVLDKVRDAEAARRFLDFVERFKARVAWHGHSAEGNPSGGNKYRGLYNIYLKSLGAATKRHPDVRLDYVVDYAVPMDQPGFYFMDSPGNDLESVAGQVGAGCNLIFFVTGNGSITNFPFVPTVKIVTTTERYQLLSQEMDINAGAYLDGVPMETLGAEMLDYTVAVASGQLSVGEVGGHAQVQIWRDWPQSQPVNLDALQNPAYSGEPVPVILDESAPTVDLTAYRTGQGWTTDQIGLILPTSLCSGQIAKMAVEHLNNHVAGAGISRFVSLTHTEGCGSSGNAEFHETLLGYLSHGFVRYGLLLEHGCEATHNRYFHDLMTRRGVDPEQYGWASVQWDGGIQNVIEKIAAWFRLKMAEAPAQRLQAGGAAVRMGWITQGQPSAPMVQAVTRLIKQVVGGGGVFVLNEQDRLRETDYWRGLGLSEAPPVTLGYGQPVRKAGFYVMAAPTHHWAEQLTGLGATGVEVLISGVTERPMSGHPMIPVLQVGTGADVPAAYQHDLDLMLGDDAADWALEILDLAVRTLSQDYQPKAQVLGNTVFQITRGLLGISL